MAHSDHWHARYSRQLALEDIGADGQDVLTDSRVMVAGCGGLGGLVSLYLAGAGVGCIRIVDSDRIELSNLHRQIQFTTDDVGRYKAEILHERLAALNPSITIESHHQHIDDQTVGVLTDQRDVIIDCTDNFATRYCLNDAAIKSQTILVSGAALGTKGQVASFKSHRDNHLPCYRCFCPDAPIDEPESCSSAGVLGPLVGWVASMQASLIIRELLHQGPEDTGYIYCVDATLMQVKTLRCSSNPECISCMAPLDQGVRYA